MESRAHRTDQTLTPRSTLISTVEIAALLRVSQDDVAAWLASGALDAVSREGSVFVNGEALWAQLDPEAEGLPPNLVKSARRIAARSSAAVESTCGI